MIQWFRLLIQGAGFHPRLGNWIPHAAMKILCATTKTGTIKKNKVSAQHSLCQSLVPTRLENWRQKRTYLKSVLLDWHSNFPTHWLGARDAESVKSPVLGPFQMNRLYWDRLLMLIIHLFFGKSLTILAQKSVDRQWQVILSCRVRHNGSD